MHSNKVLASCLVAVACLLSNSFGQASLPVDCGEVVTTHFSGLDLADRPDPNGAVLTLVDTRIPPVGSTPWPTAGQLWSPPLFSNLGAGPDEWTAINLGTIFGLAFATGTDPDIFVAASPGIYGDYEPIYVIGPAGAAGIYRIDGTTGQISTFIPTGFNGTTEMPNLGPGIGNIHIENNGPNQTDQVYATNLDDGKIYLIDVSGTIVQVYDPFGAGQIVDGQYANLGERPFAVAINPQGTRLYFSIWLRDNGRQTTPWPASAGPAPTNPNNSIWSVAVGQDGFLTGAPQLEIVLPYLYGTYSNPVTDISFTTNGDIQVAERVFVSDYGQFDVGHSARVLEFTSTGAPSSRNWSLGASLNNGIAANSVGGVGSDDDSHTWATCDQIVGGGTYGITRLPFPGNTLATRITSSIPIDIPGPLKNGMGELDVMNCGTPEIVGACCVTDTNGVDYCVEVTQIECTTAYNGIYMGDGIACVDAQTCPTITYGACCYEDADLGWTCIDGTTDSDCTSIYAGTWYANTPCSQIDCPPIINDEGACCYEDADLGWTCIWIDQGECDNTYFGTYYAGVPCVDIDCPPLNDEGACCYVIDCVWDCNMVFEEDCDAFNGTFYLNTPCEDIICPDDDFGACCYQDGALGQVCQDNTDYGTCLDLMGGNLGAWYPGETCECIPCETEPTGACCYTIDCVWQCDMLTADDCTTLLGNFYLNYACDDITCTDPLYGACCYENAKGVMTCVYTNIEKCEFMYFGTFYPEESCECEPCDGDPPLCEVIASPNCVGPPQYPYPDYTIFGNGHIAIQTASTSILGGSTLMLFDLSGTLPVDTAFPLHRYSHPSWEHPNNDPAPNMGSIFGLAVDEDGNIYVSTTKTWNQDIAGTGGWGAVYKIDTNTALPELFASIPMPNNESGLGTITYDCDHSQFFVSNFEDGLIYRLDMNGNILDSFDHTLGDGLQSGYPGPAVFGDRPWAVEVHGERLYYSMWNENMNEPSSMTNEIWSVPLDGIGAPIPGAEQHEITMPPIYSQGDWSSPVSDIDFSQEGTMFVSERTQTGFSTLLAHSSRVLEYECTTSGWSLTTNQFLVGVGGRNASGGVDATNHGIWASGDGLHMSVGDQIYGFQGIPVTGGDTTTSVLVDYQDDLTGQDKTMIGDIIVTDEDGGGTTEGACCYYEPDLCLWRCIYTNSNDCDAVGGTFYADTPCEFIDCPNDPYGACCYQDVDGTMNCVETDADNCEFMLQGIWYQGLPCECVDCDPEPTGACCYLIECEWYCTELTQAHCYGFNGTYYANTLCDDINCPDPDFGACCYQDADLGMMCVFIDGPNCANVGGTWYSGVTCECAPVCEPPTGACCYMADDGTMDCTIVTYTQCSQLSNWTYLGNGTTCVNAICCAPVGACCILGDCLLASSEQCAAAEGTFYGNGIVCSGIDCYFCTGDLNNDGVVNVSDLLILIAAFGACP